MAEYESQDIKRIISNLSANLDAIGIKEGSFLYNLARAVKDEKDTSLSSINSTLRNIHIDTCDAIYDNYFGDDLGVRRLSVPYFAVLAEDNICYIETPDGSNFPAFINGEKIAIKGQTFSYGKLTITADEDWLVDATKNKIFVSATISALEDYVFAETTYAKLETSSPYFKYLAFRVTQGISFTYINESTSVFKNRVILEIKNAGIRSPAYTTAYIESILGIKKIVIISDKYNNKMYFTTDEMFKYGEDVSTDKYKKIIESELLNILVWPTTYEVIPADKGTLMCEYTVIGAMNGTSAKLKYYMANMIASLVERGTSLTKDNIQLIVNKETGETIRVTDLYIVDSVTSAKITDWQNSYDMYIYVSQENIIEV